MGGPGSEGPEVTGDGYRRPWLLYSVVGLIVVAVLVGTVLRFTGSGNSSRATPSTSSSASADTDSAAGRSTAGQRAEPSARATTPAPTTDVTVGHRELSGLHLGHGAELFVLGRHALVHLEPATDTVTTTRIEALHDASAALVVGSDRVLLQPDGTGWIVVPDGRPAHHVTTRAEASRVLPGPEADTVWALRLSPGRDSSALLRGFDGRDAGDSVRTPAVLELFFAQSDGQGHLLVPGVGGTYRVRPEGVRRVTRGAVLAVGSDMFLAVECTTHARCHVVVIDRSTGKRHTIGTGRQLHQLVQTAGKALGYGRVSPDGRTAAVISVLGRPRLLLVDLRSGRTTSFRLPLPRSLRMSPDSELVAWSPDSARVYTVFDDKLWAVDPETARGRVVGLPLDGMRGVAVRP